MSNKVTTADGTELYVKDWGRGSVLFFVSSAAVSNEMWQYQHAHFVKQGYRVVTYDRRGHGRSDQPATGYDADTFADDMAAVISAKRLENITIIAHSFGCAETVRYLSRHGEAAVSRVVLLGTTTPFLLTTNDNPASLDGALADGQRAAWAKDYPKWVTDSVRPFFVPETSVGMTEWASRLLYETPVMVATAVNLACTDTDFRADVKGVTVPTLIIHGGRDASCPLELTARRTAKLMPHAQMKIYEGAPHGLMFTHMDRFHADVEGFIRETK